MAAVVAGGAPPAPHRHDVRALELDAYMKVVRCFMQGPYDLVSMPYCCFCSTFYLSIQACFWAAEIRLQTCTAEV
jgi:hypothetical protein